MIVKLCEDKLRAERERALATVVDARLLATHNYRVHRDRWGREWRKPAK